MENLKSNTIASSPAYNKRDENLKDHIRPLKSKQQLRNMNPMNIGNAFAQRKDQIDEEYGINSRKEQKFDTSNMPSLLATHSPNPSSIPLHASNQVPLNTQHNVRQPEISLHPFFRNQPPHSSENPASGARLTMMLKSLLPRSPSRSPVTESDSTKSKTKDTVKRTSINNAEDFYNDLKYRSKSFPRDHYSTTPSPTKMKEFEPLDDEAYSDRSSEQNYNALNPTTTTPSKAAKLLGLGDHQFTPSKATRILGSGIGVNDEFIHKKTRKTSREHAVNTSPSKRMARLLEGAVAKLNRHSLEAQDSQHETTNTSSLNINSMKVDNNLFTPALRRKDGMRNLSPTRPSTTPNKASSSGLKYLDNSLPPTPPEKDTVYRTRIDRTKSAKVSKSKNSLTTPSDLKNFENPIIKAQKVVHKVDLVTQPSFHSMTGIIESNTAQLKTVRSAEELRTKSKKSYLHDIFVTPTPMASNIGTVTPKPEEFLIELTPESDERQTEKVKAKAKIDATAGNSVCTGNCPEFSCNPAFIAPPEDVLTHFDVVNTHIMRATASLHEQIENWSLKKTKDDRKKQSDIIKLLNERFSEIYSQVKHLEQTVDRVTGDIGYVRESITNKLEMLATVIQTSLIKRLDEETMARAEVARRLDFFQYQLHDTTMRQQLIIDVLKGNGLQMPLESGMPNISPQAMNGVNGMSGRIINLASLGDSFLSSPTQR